MTRRDLGKIALFQAAIANAQTAKKYTGALDGVESKVDANKEHDRGASDLAVVGKTHDAGNTIP